MKLIRISDTRARVEGVDPIEVHRQLVAHGYEVNRKGNWIFPAPPLGRLEVQLDFGDTGISATLVKKPMLLPYGVMWQRIEEGFKALPQYLKDKNINVDP